MRTISDLAELEAIYDEAAERSLTKVVTHITPLYRTWIERSRFCILSTVGPEGTDATPRGDDGPVVRIVDEKTLRMPDWRGNNRLDALRNIVRDPRVSLLFMVPGSNTVVRVNGKGAITADTEVVGTFEQAGARPRTVLSMSVDEVYFQCAKALMRSGLWTRNDSEGLPSAGAFLKERDAAFDAETYDATYPDYARPRMW